MDIPILFEDDDILVINKPEGITVHPDGFHTDKTIAEWFLEKCPKAKGVGESQMSSDGKGLERSGVVHRIDKDTSGVLVLAKTQLAYEHLKKQFHDRLAKKTYRAFVYGLFREKYGMIDRPIGRSVKNFRKRSAQRGARGTMRDAQTQWDVIMQGKYHNEDFSYLNLIPKTGRTHQIRAHLRAIDRPVVGDVLYSDYKLANSNNLGFNRMALHSYILELELPDGNIGIFQAPIPQSFEDAVKCLTEECRCA